MRKYTDRDKERGLIKPEVDSDLVADTFITLILKNETFFIGLDEDKYFKKLTDVMKILKEGIAFSRD